MKYLITLCSIILLLSNLELRSQALRILDLIDPNQQNTALMYGGEGEVNYIGSPFFIEDWVIGNVKTNTGTEFKNIRLKYESYRNYLFTKKEEESIVITNDLIETFSFDYDGETYNFKNMQLPESGDRKSFVRVIYEGERVSIYQAFSKKLLQGGTIDNGYTSVKKTKDKFIDVEKLYAKINGEVKEIGTSKKYFYELFPQKENEIKTFFKTNDVNTKETKGLVKLATYLDDLVE